MRRTSWRSVRRQKTPSQRPAWCECRRTGWRLGLIDDLPKAAPICLTIRSLHGSEEPPRTWPTITDHTRSSPVARNALASSRPNMGSSICQDETSAFFRPVWRPALGGSSCFWDGRPSSCPMVERIWNPSSPGHRERGMLKEQQVSHDSPMWKHRRRQHALVR
jgi:hypothetical protein